MGTAFVEDETAEDFDFCERCTWVFGEVPHLVGDSRLVSEIVSKLRQSEAYFNPQASDLPRLVGPTCPIDVKFILVHLAFNNG